MSNIFEAVHKNLPLNSRGGGDPVANYITQTGWRAFIILLTLGLIHVVQCSVISDFRSSSIPYKAEATLKLTYVAFSP